MITLAKRAPQLMQPVSLNPFPMATLSLAINTINIDFGLQMVIPSVELPLKGQPPAHITGNQI